MKIFESSVENVTSMERCKLRTLAKDIKTTKLRHLSQHHKIPCYLGEDCMHRGLSMVIYSNECRATLDGHVSRPRVFMV